MAKNNLVPDRIQAVWNILGGDEGIDLILAGKTKVVPAESTEDPKQFTVTVTGINRKLKPETVIDKTGCAKNVTGSVLAATPRCTEHGSSVKLVFFRLEKHISPSDLQAECERRGLIHDPYALAKHVQENPEFANTHHCATQWTDAGGKYCYLAINHWGDERNVYVRSREDNWPSYYWFAGVRKT